MESISKRILHIANILVLIAMPIVVCVTESLYWTVADPRQSFNGSSLCWFFVFPCIIVAALIVLLRQKLNVRLYSAMIEGQNCDSKVLTACWILKFGLFLAAGLFVVHGFATNTKTWDLNWNYCAMSLAFITPAMVIHSIEFLYKWWPLIKMEMTSEHNLAIRILLTGKTLLFSSIAARKTVLEKIIHTIRSLYWFGIVIKVLWSFPSVFLFTAVSLYESFYLKVGVVIGWNYLFVGGLRLIELIFIDKD